jgi:hypothetical protein
MKPIGAVLIILIVTGFLAVSHAVRSQESGSGTTAAQVPSHAGERGMSGMVNVPAAPTDGVLTIVIPPGTDAAMKRTGDAGYHLPSVMRLDVGDTIVIRNDDDAPHMILYTFLLPGQTDRRTFTTAGSEAYSSGCSANAAQFPDFTTIFIRDH